MLKAALHVHSTYSDGEFTLAELKQIYAAEGCSAICMTDHAESFDPEKLKQYRRECESLSDSSMLFVCGLEYECEQRMHILGYGTTALAKTKDPQQVIRHIEENGGVCVIAHPKDSMFDWIDGFGVLPKGIETWNSKYDGRYAPRPGTFELLYRLRKRRPDMLAFYGQDLHWKKQYRGLFNVMDATSNTAQSILAALANGRYSAIKGELQLPSSGIISSDLMASFAQQHAQSDRVRNFLKSGKRALDRMGIAVPASIKSQLRRIF
jgi:hypothetical protein